MTPSERRWPRELGPWLAAGLLFLLLAAYARGAAESLSRPAIGTGIALLTLVLFLAAFNARKRLSMLPLGSATAWLSLHAAGGALAIGLYFLHAGTLWPLGFYPRALAGLFYLVSASGIVGFVMQRTYPRLLTATEVEVIYERIPQEIARLREEAEALVLRCTQETGSDTLARYYLENLDWFFRRPRFVWSHALGSDQRGRRWARQQVATVRRYLDQKEREYLDRLARLAYHKNGVDFHYGAQSAMKGWLFAHLPLTAAFLVLAAWHLALVLRHAF